MQRTERFRQATELSTSFLSPLESQTQSGYTFPIEGIKTYLDDRAATAFKNHLSWIGLATTYKIKPEVVVCIAWADSQLGNKLATRFNVGNVGNTDSGSRRSYDTPEEGIEAIYKVLNNQALGHKQTLGSLSRGGGGTGAVYATSTFNWNNNTKSCISRITGQKVDESYKIRF